MIDFRNKDSLNLVNQSVKGRLKSVKEKLKSIMCRLICLYLNHEQKDFYRIDRFDGHLHFGDYCCSAGVDGQRY